MKGSRLEIVCQSKPVHPVLQGAQPCQAVAGMRATCQRLLGWGMRTFGRWPSLGGEGCEFGVGEAGGVEGGGTDAVVELV